MSPIWMLEGTRERDPVAERNLAERRFSALAAAVRDHESEARRQVSGAKAHDITLYRRMRRILAQREEAE